jgi:3-oxoacyl-[acyl-carrier protein] reductase
MRCKTLAPAFAVTWRVPVGRLGRAEEVVDLILALVRNPYLTGQSILIDGGIYPR